MTPEERAMVDRLKRAEDEVGNRGRRIARLKQQVATLRAAIRAAVEEEREAWADGIGSLLDTASGLHWDRDRLWGAVYDLKEKLRARGGK